MALPTTVAAYMALFGAFGFAFLFLTLLVGWFLRPREPNVEKLDVYECGEPTIGSSFVQFDLRFYVVALLFIIFDVEVALFFPWATVFGKTTHLMDPNFPKATAQGELTPEATALFIELGVERPSVPPLPPAIEAEVGASLTAEQRAEVAIENLASHTALFTMADIGVFFTVLLVGFAYVWKRGDLDWVRALSRERALEARAGPPSPVTEEEPALSP